METRGMTVIVADYQRKKSQVSKEIVKKVLEAKFQEKFNYWSGNGEFSELWIDRVLDRVSSKLYGTYKRAYELGKRREENYQSETRYSRADSMNVLCVIDRLVRVSFRQCLDTVNAFRNISYTSIIFEAEEATSSRVRVSWWSKDRCDDILAAQKRSLTDGTGFTVSERWLPESLGVEI